MNNCKTCVHAIFDEHWGEYKCTLTKHRMHMVNGLIKCDGYKEGEPTVKKTEDSE
jgi:hypothetical protein